MHRAVVLASLLIVAGCGGGRGAVPGDTSSAPTIPAVTDMGGEVVVTDLDAVRLSRTGSRCVALGAYADVREGVPVEVRSDTGVIKAIMPLQPGRLRESGTAKRPPGCVFRFSYSGAAAGRPAFGVKVGERTPVTVSYRDLTRMRILFPQP